MTTQKTEAVAAASPAAAAEGAGKKKRKGGRLADRSFQVYIRRIQKKIFPELAMTDRMCGVLDDFIKHTVKSYTQSGSRIAHCAKRSKLTLRDLQAALNLALPEDLKKCTITEAMKAVTSYNQFSAGDEKEADV